MQVLNVSYNDPQVKRAVEQACGSPYGFWESVRRGGVGSERILLVDGPASLLEMIDRAEDRGYCSFEARRKGLVIRFRSRLETLAIPIGFEEIREVVLGSPGEGRDAPLLIVLLTGERLLFSLRKEQWGGISALLRRTLAAEKLRLSASSRF